ncbi:hypothetical protein [Pedobacter metabolipauper]|uniref:Tetratricopeptide repeat protein n=1 Tax=Pedobacter metabolipauper TaxID=425513 RepID=A0A4R6SRG1_9SPHI|nr:hypothetical protein [Pedobacter metabolipauper]TDQ06230.1 hypothetical protein ATK78_4611 [Pedobacter metabolipauper]
MLINPKADIQLNEYELFLEGALCINSSQWLPAYSIFKQLTDGAKNPSVARLYNMALCHFSAKEYLQTISVLNEAIQHMAVPSGFSKQSSRVPDVLLAHEYEHNAHESAITENIVSLNASVVKLRIRRLLVDANLELENWEEVIRLSTLPDMDKCKNVMQAVTIAKTKINN